MDEKIQRLSEGPTNSIDGVYSLNPPGFRLGEKDPAKTFYPDVDGNWPAGIPGIPGELSYTRPEGYWSGESDWDSINQTDFSQDYLLTDPTGTSTAGLIAENGTVLSQLPPGGQAFILGPIVDGFVPNHTSDAYTNIGYLQKDTRQFVLLARIQGQWKSNLNGNYPIWNGSSGQLTIYNQNFTLAMAEWVKDQIVTSENFTPNVPYFYSGGVPQVPQSDADCPNCPPGMYGGNGVGGNSYGSGGNPNVGNQQGSSSSGGPGAAGYPWGGKGGGSKGGKGGGKGGGKVGGKGDGPKKPGPKTPGPKTPGPKIVGPKIVGPKIVGPKIDPGTLGQLGARILRSITDGAKFAGDYIFKGLPSNIPQYLPNFTGAGPSGLPKIADMPRAVARWATGGKDNPISRVIDNTVQAVLGKNYASQYFTPDLQTAINYAGEGGKVVAIPRTDGIMGLKNWFGSNVSRGFDFTKGVEQLVSTADTISIDAAGKTKIFNATDITQLQNLAAKGAQTAGYMEVLGRAIPFVGGAAAIADVGMRISKGDYTGAVLGGISAIPGPVGWVGLGAQVAADLSGVTDPNSEQNKNASWVITNIVDGIPSNMSGLYLGMSHKMTGPLLSEETSINAKQKYLNNMQKALFELGFPKDINEFARQQALYLMLNGVKPQLILLIVKAIVKEEYTKDEKEYLKNNLKSLVALFASIKEETMKNKTKKNKLKENILYEPQGQVLSENRRRILREIKKPYVLLEIPKQKYKMNFSGKFKPQNTPDVTASSKSDELVASGNAKGQKWRLKDKYWQGYETTERMNIIYDRVGHGDQAWEMIIGENQNKKREHARKLQEHLNIRAHERVMRQENADYASPFRLAIQEQETMQANKDPLFKRVSKRLKKEIDYLDKPAKNGYPNDPPPEMVNGWHSEYGNDKGYYNKLDPQSAEAMPLTGNPEIDKRVKKARKQPK